MTEVCIATPVLNRAAAFGTGGGRAAIRLDDRHELGVVTGPDSTAFDYVLLLGRSCGNDWGDLTAPDDDRWGEGEGRGGYTVHRNVPVAAVRDLIEAHGGEHSIQEFGIPSAPFQIGQRSWDGYTVYRDGRPIGTLVWREDHWIATSSCAHRQSDTFDGAQGAQPAYWLLDLAAEADVIAGRATTAAADLLAALKGHGLTAQMQENNLGDGVVLTWLAVGTFLLGGRVDESKPHATAHITWMSGDEVTVGRPIRRGDEWKVDVYTESDSDTITFLGGETKDVAAFLADWHANPRC